MIKIQEATKEVITHISQCDRKDLSEKSRRIAEEEIAKMKKIIEDGKKRRVKYVS
jgi:hypothetical protein